MTGSPGIGNLVFAHPCFFYYEGEKILHVLVEFLLQIRMFPENYCYS